MPPRQQHNPGQTSAYEHAFPHHRPPPGLPPLPELPRCGRVEPALNCLAALRLFAADTEVHPGRPVTRDELATVVVRALTRASVPLPPGASALDRLAAAGVAMPGGPSSTALVSRAEAAGALASAYSLVLPVQSRARAPVFTDLTDVPQAADVEGLAAFGAVTGTGAATSSPNQPLTRAALAVWVAHGALVASRDVLPIRVVDRQRQRS